MRARSAGKCKQCGLSHSKLGVEIVGTALYRDVVRERHLLRNFGGGWAYLATLVDKHPEIAEFVIVDDAGIEYRASRETTDRYGLRRDLGRGEQVILPLKFWRTVPPGGVIEHAPATVANRETPGPQWEQLGLVV